jgi:outer membrane protein TolC
MSQYWVCFELVKNLKLKTTKAIILFFAIACLAFKGFGQQFNSNVKSKTDSIVVDTSSKKTIKAVIDTINFDPDMDLAEQLIPLDSILDFACKFSPSIKMVEAEIDRFKFNTKYISTIWLNGIGVFYNYTYGNQFSSLASTTVAGTTQSSSLGIGDRYGVNVQFLLGEIYGYKNRMKSLKAEVEMARQKRLEVMIEIKRRIIADYYNLVTNQRLVKIKQADAESATISSNIAEYEMKRGKITPAELSRLKNVQSIADINLELSRRDYITVYCQFEALLGCRLSNLKKKK